jgi:hypothetical protein
LGASFCNVPSLCTNAGNRITNSDFLFLIFILALGLL